MVHPVGAGRSLPGGSILPKDEEAAAIKLAGSFLIAAGVLVAAGAAAVEEDTAAICDRLAGSPFDPNRVGEGVPFDDLDVAVAEAPCRQAAADNPADPRLQFELARVLQAKGETAAAIASYETLAAGGYSVAALALGRTLQSEGTDDAYARAAAYFRQALAGGIQAAAADLAVLTMNGFGVPLDYAESLRLLAAPAEAGDGYAQYLLGYLYENGLGVEADLARAVELYRASAETGQGGAEYSLGYLYDHGEGVEENIPEALRLYHLAAQHNYPIGLVAVGAMYFDGRGVPRDVAEAERWYRKAIESGDAEAALSGKNSLAWSLMIAGADLAEAERLASEAVAESAEPVADYFDTLGSIRHRMGRHEEAAEALEQAVALEGAYAPYHDRLGDVDAALGRSDEARGEWQKALDLPPPHPADEGGWDRAAIERKVLRVQ